LIRKRWQRAAVTLLVAGALATGCTSDKKQPAASEDIQGNQQAVTQGAVGNLITDIPTYRPKDSAERRNNNERLKRWENPNKVGYIALIALDGTLVWYGTIKGKPSSLNSHNSNDEDIRWTCRRNHGCHPVPVSSPDLDGSWGDNPAGIYFIDSNDIYHEWNATYFLSDAPSKLTQQPKLQVVAGAGPTANK